MANITASFEKSHESNTSFELEHPNNFEKEEEFEKIENYNEELYSSLLESEYLDPYSDLFEDQRFAFVNNVKIDILSDGWDFSPLHFEGKNPNQFKLDFSKIDDFTFKMIIKFYTLYRIFSTTVYQSTHKASLSVLTVFVNFLSDNNIYKITNITMNDLNNYMRIYNNQLAAGTKEKKKHYLYEFFVFVEAVTGKEINEDILEYLETSDIRALKAQNLSNWTKTLPDEFGDTFKDLIYEKILEQIAFKQSNSKKFNYSTLMYCSQLYILNQCGIRPMESIILPRDCITLENLDRDDRTKSVYYLHYRSTKKSSNKYIYARTKIVPKVVEIIDFLRSLSNDKNYLFKNRDKDIHKLSEFFTKFCIIHADILNLINSNNQDCFYHNKTVQSLLDSYKHYENSSINKLMKNNKEIRNEDVISIPRLYQFRVFFATYSTDKGIHPVKVAMMMNQNTKEMIGYYNRPKQIEINKRENEKNIKIFESVINDEFMVHGPRAKSRTRQMRQAYKKAKENAVDKTNKNHEITKEAMKDVPMRLMNGGCCIKAGEGIDCTLDNVTDISMCANKICPNQHFFIFNLNFYYQQFKKEIDNYYKSLDSKLYRNAEKSLNNIKYYIKTKLEEEMDGLKLHMDDNSINNLISKYSSLQFYKDNYEKIRGEMEQWKNKEIKL